MTVRIDPDVCFSCGHDPNSYNPICTCAPCHNVFHGSRVGCEPLASSPVRAASSPTSPSPDGSHRSGWGAASHLLIAAACIVLMSTMFGALHGWHTSAWDVIAGGVLAMVLVVVGAWVRNDERGR